jgi:hypothetical protein
MANVKISILTEFLGKGIKDANKSVKGLESSVKNLGYIFGGGFLGAKVLAFSKTAVKAFAADDKAAQTLTRTLTNLGLAFEDVRVSNFIAELERTYGVLDDQLRPAFQQLLTTTGSVSEAQKALQSALDLSAASGVDVASVAADLSKAYVGQTRALAKYGLGLSQAELKGMKFEEVQARINRLFGGQAALVADTYAGKIDKLNVAAAQATETLGKGLVDAISKLGGTGADNIDNVTKSMNDLAKAGSAIINTFADVFQAVVHPIEYLNQDLRGPAYKGAIPSIQAELSTKVFEDRMKALREEAALAKKITDDKKKQVALEKQKNALAKASNILNAANKLFDDKAIQLAAAMQSKLTEEDKVRVKLKQDILGLEEAIQSGNVKSAASFANAIAQGSQQLSILRGDLANFKNIDNPFNAWLETIKAMAAELAALANIKPIMPPSQGQYADYNAFDFYNSLDAAGKADLGGYSPYMNYSSGYASQGALSVNVNIDGQTIANALVNTSNSGTSSSSARNTGQFK